MPFAWTAVHLVDVITGASAADLNNQGDKEPQASKDGSISGRKVKLKKCNIILSNALTFTGNPKYGLTHELQTRKLFV